VLLALHRQYERTVAILRIVVLLMMPFCWVVFHDHESYPREGHFLWLFGMVLVVFSFPASGDDPVESPISLMDPSSR